MYTISMLTYTPFFLPSFTVIPRCYSDRGFRLINSTTNFFAAGSFTVEGRIEVCINSTYSSLCDYYWNPVDVQVYCHYMASLYGVPASANISKEVPVHVHATLSSISLLWTA